MRDWSIWGLACGLVFLVCAIALTAREPLILVNLPGLLLVLGGTFAATLTSFSWREIVAAFDALSLQSRSKDDRDHLGLRHILIVAQELQRNGVQAAEKAVKRVEAPFLKTGLQLVIDGAPSDQVAEVLDWRVARLRAHGESGADVFRAMAVYAPAFGMVGTLLGLVNMLRDVGGGIDEVGANLAVALVTTFYGIVLANAVFKPLSVCLHRQAQDRIAVLSVAQEALLLLAAQQSVSQLRYCLSTFVDPEDPELIQPIGEGRLAHA